MNHWLPIILTTLFAVTAVYAAHLLKKLKDEKHKNKVLADLAHRLVDERDALAGRVDMWKDECRKMAAVRSNPPNLNPLIHGDNVIQMSDYRK